MIRTPLVPFTDMVDWQELSTSEVTATNAELSHSGGQQERARFVAWLRRRFRDPLLREAILVASRSLFAALESWLQDDSPSDHAVHSVARYFSRMAARSTPFGMFAACTLGQIGSQTRLEASGPLERRVQLDLNYAMLVARAVAGAVDLAPTATFFPNTTIYPRADELIFMSEDYDGGERRLQQMAVRRTGAIEHIIERCRSGATRTDLQEALCQSFSGIDARSASALVSAAIEAQLVISDAEPAITGDGPLEELIQQVGRWAPPFTAAPPPMQHALESLREQLRRIEGGTGDVLQHYRDSLRVCEAIPTRPSSASILHVDLFRRTEDVSISETVAHEFLRGADVLYRLCPRPPNSALERFKRRFTERWDTRSVPLMEALDDESGIGFEETDGDDVEVSVLTDGLEVLRPFNQASSLGATIPRLFERACGVDRRGDCLELTDEDITMVGGGALTQIPGSFSVVGTVLAASNADIDRGAFSILLKGAGGPSGVNSFGRFCHDRGIRTAVQRHLEAEERAAPDCIFAEVVHMPSGRSANIVKRPRLRRYEIPYAGTTAAEPEYQIPVRELLVSVRNDRVQLESVRLGRRIIPRMTATHRPKEDDSTVYRFLTAVRSDGLVPGASWSWGALGNASYLPRVTYGRLILAEALWNVSERELGSLHGGPLEKRVEAFRELARRLDWPRWISIGDTDERLVVDLLNPLSIESALREMAPGGRVSVREWLSSPGSLCMSSGAQLFAHELVIPFARRESSEPANAPILDPASRVSVPRSARTFLPGSEWTTFKLYSGAAIEDRILRDVVSQVVNEGSRSGSLRRWFFVRFKDPWPHLRVRFQCQANTSNGWLWPFVNNLAMPLVDAGLLWKIDAATYEREVERYGGLDGVELAEQYFHADSQTILTIINELDDVAVSERRWMFALRGIDQLLASIAGESIADRLAIMELHRTALRQEFHVGGRAIRHVGDVFRRFTKDINETVGTTRRVDRPLIELAFERRERCVRVVGDGLRALRGERALASPISAVVRSYIHMHVNRMLTTDARRQEWILSELLVRHYRSRVHRD